MVKVLGVGVLSYSNIEQSIISLEGDKVINLYASIESKPSISWRKDTIIFDFYQCVSAQYNIENCMPIDGLLLDSMLSAEVIFLKMIERSDYQDRMSYYDRKSSYLNHLTYWNDHLKVNKPDCVIFYNFPHEMYDYVIYSLCKVMGIKVLIFDDINFCPDTLFLIESIEESAIEIRDKLKEIKMQGSDFQLKKLQVYLDDFNKQDASFSPKMINDLKEEQIQKGRILEQVKIVAKKILSVIKGDRKIFRRDFGIRYRPYMMFQERRLFSYYDKHSINTPDLNQKYIYLALHYQPECSSSPMGGHYVEQHLIADLIAKNLPKGWFLYVKEHPLQKKHGRNVELYKRLVKMEKVLLVSRNYPSINLIKKSIAVATLTGTTGWEGFLTKKPVLKFGHSYYQYAPGVYKINSSNDVKLAIKKIKNGTVITDTDIKQFLKAMELVSIDAWVLDFLKKPMTTLSNKEVVENISNALIKRLSLL
jgi:hypothetical protein